MTLLPGANVGSAASLASTASADEANCVLIDDNSEHFSILQSTRLNFVPPKPKILQGACQMRLAGPGWPGPAPAEQLAANADGHWRTAGQDNIRHMYLYRASAREPHACCTQTWPQWPSEAWRRLSERGSSSCTHKLAHYLPLFPSASQAAWTSRP